MKQKATGKLLTFNKKHSNSLTYKNNGFSYKPFGDEYRILVYTDEKSALNEDLSKVIGRAYITFNDKDVNYDIEFIDTVPSIKFLDKWKQNKEKCAFYPAGKGDVEKGKVTNFNLIGIYPAEL